MFCVMAIILGACGVQGVRFYWARRKRENRNYVHRPLPRPGRAQAGCVVAPHTQVTYVPFSNDPDGIYDDVLVVDCTHVSAATLSHHKGHSNVAGIPLSDSSTGLVLNALGMSDGSPELEKALCKAKVTSNHFDEDAVLSMWSWMDRDICSEYSRSVLSITLFACCVVGAYRLLFPHPLGQVEVGCSSKGKSQVLSTR
jgi:hypothetical protein